MSSRSMSAPRCTNVAVTSNDCPQRRWPWSEGVQTSQTVRWFLHTSGLRERRELDPERRIDRVAELLFFSRQHEDDVGVAGELGHGVACGLEPTRERGHRCRRLLDAERPQRFGDRLVDSAEHPCPAGRFRLAQYLEHAGHRGCRCRRRTPVPSLADPAPCRRACSSQAEAGRIGQPAGLVCERWKLRPSRATLLYESPSHGLYSPGSTRTGPVFILADTTDVHLERLPRPEPSRICSGKASASPASLNASCETRPAVWWLECPSRWLPWKRDTITSGRSIRMMRTTSRSTFSLPSAAALPPSASRSHSR